MMTASVHQAGNRPLNSAADESATVSLEKRIQAERREVEAGSPVTQNGVDEPDNLELCRQILIKQLMMDMVTKKDDSQDDWMKEWL